MDHLFFSPEMRKFSEFYQNCSKYQIYKNVSVCFESNDHHFLSAFVINYFKFFDIQLKLIFIFTRQIAFIVNVGSKTRELQIIQVIILLNYCCLKYNQSSSI